MNFCPVKRFGLGEDNAVRATNVRLGPTASEFEIPSAKFHLNLAGEFNVRNALAVVAAAKHCGLSNKQIQSAFDTFKGIKRRMEVRGIAGGVTVIDDFGHHPTAHPRNAAGVAPQVCRTTRSGPIFEPRSNTTRRNVFQNGTCRVFRAMPTAWWCRRSRGWNCSRPRSGLNPEQLMADLKAAGKDAAYLPDADAIVAHLATKVQGGDIVVRVQQRRLWRDSWKVAGAAGAAVKASNPKPE